jgi:peptide/nickel transport system permease protein
MIAYLLRRLMWAIPTLIGVNLLVFTLFFIVNSPDDMARAQLGSKRVTQEAIERWKADRGYDKPLFWNSRAQGLAQVSDTIFVQKSARMFLLDFGKSDVGRDINRELSQRMWPSLALALPVFVLGLFAAIVFALVLVFFRATWLDFTGVVLCVVLMSISALFYILAGQYLFARTWNLVPISVVAAAVET